MSLADEGADSRAFYADRDRAFWLEVNQLAADSELSLETVLQHFMAFVRRRDFVQTIAYTDYFA
jgi:hypothetical protein